MSTRFNILQYAVYGLRDMSTVLAKTARQAQTFQHVSTRCALNSGWLLDIYQHCNDDVYNKHKDRNKRASRQINMYQDKCNIVKGSVQIIKMEI